MHNVFQMNNLVRDVFVSITGFIDNAHQHGYIENSSMHCHIPETVKDTKKFNDSVLLLTQTLKRVLKKHGATNKCPSYTDCGYDSIASKTSTERNKSTSLFCLYYPSSVSSQITVLSASCHEGFETSPTALTEPCSDDVPIYCGKHNHSKLKSSQFSLILSESVKTCASDDAELDDVPQSQNNHSDNLSPNTDLVVISTPQINDSLINTSLIGKHSYKQEDPVSSAALSPTDNLTVFASNCSTISTFSSSSLEQALTSYCNADQSITNLTQSSAPINFVPDFSKNMKALDVCDPHEGITLRNAKLKHANSVDSFAHNSFDILPTMKNSVSNTSDAPSCLLTKTAQVDIDNTASKDSDAMHTVDKSNESMVVSSTAESYSYNTAAINQESMCNSNIMNNLHIVPVVKVQPVCKSRSLMLDTIKTVSCSSKNFSNPASDTVSSSDGNGSCIENNKFNSTMSADNSLYANSMTENMTSQAPRQHSNEDLSEETLPVNSEETVDDVPIYCCLWCNLCFVSREDIVDHTCKNIDIMDDDSKCDENATEGKGEDIFINSLEKLKKHKKFVCSICSLELRSLSRIIYHLSKCSPGPYPCTCCNEFHSTRKALHYHMDHSHAGEKCYVCSDCGKSFLVRSSLFKHMGRYHETNTAVGPFKCNICSKTFIKQIYLTNHKIRMHKLNKKFECQDCGNKFLNHSSLNVHKKIAHDTDSPKFICTMCSKTFSRKEKLLHHQMRHKGERPHVCKACGMGFISKDRLNEHDRRMHQTRTKKRFTCPHCKKNYANSRDVRKHSRHIHGIEIEGPVPVSFVAVGDSETSAPSQRASNKSKKELYCSKQQKSTPVIGVQVTGTSSVSTESVCTKTASAAVLPELSLSDHINAAPMKSSVHILEEAEKNSDNIHHVPFYRQLVISSSSSTENNFSPYIHHPVSLAPHNVVSISVGSSIGGIPSNSSSTLITPAAAPMIPQSCYHYYTPPLPTVQHPTTAVAPAGGILALPMTLHNTDLQSELCPSQTITLVNTADPNVLPVEGVGNNTAAPQTLVRPFSIMTVIPHLDGLKGDRTTTSVGTYDSALVQQQINTLSAAAVNNEPCAYIPVAQSHPSIPSLGETVVQCLNTPSVIEPSNIYPNQSI